MSLPDGEIVAEPTTPSTWMEPSDSKLSLSKADFTILLLGSSSYFSKLGMIAVLSVVGSWQGHVVWSSGYRRSPDAIAARMAGEDSSRVYGFDELFAQRLHRRLQVVVGDEVWEVL